MKVPKFLNVKRLLAKKTADKIRENWERPVDYLKYDAPKLRANVPPLEMAWLKVKVGTRKYFRSVGKRFEIVVGKTIEMIIKQFVNSYGWVLIILILVIILVIIATWIAC